MPLALQPQDVITRRVTGYGWYTNNDDLLGRAYSNSGSANDGGILGRIRRWFVGGTEPSAASTRYHDPIAASVVDTGASLLLGESISITATGATDDETKRLAELLDFSDIDSLLLQAAQVAGSEGGVVLRIVWDNPLFALPFIEVVRPGDVTLERKRGRNVAIRITREVAKTKNVTWRHVERHIPGRIEHSLFEGTEDKLGVQIPLTDRPETAGLVVDELGGIDTGFAGMTAVYIENQPGNSGYGFSDLCGIEDLLDGLDETLSLKMQSVRQSASKVLVPASWLKSGGPGKAARADMDKEVYVGVNNSDETFKPEQIAFPIRATDYGIAEDQLRRRIVEGAGYSPATFGMTSESTATATEIQALWRRTLSTVEAKTRRYGKGIPAIIYALIGVDAHLNGPSGLTSRVIAVEFPAVVEPSPAEQATTMLALYTSQSASIKTRVKGLHAEWSADQVDEEVADIRLEHGITVTDFGDIPE